MLSIFTHVMKPVRDTNSEPGLTQIRKYIALDPIDRSPFGHLMKFTQRSFPLHKLGLSTAGALPLLFRVKHCLETGYVLFLSWG